MERFTYRQHERRFRAACHWLRDLGVVVNATRADEYSRLLSNIALHHEAGTVDVLLDKNGFPAVVNAMTEASEFIDIHEGLGGRSDGALLERLRHFVAGTVMLSDETSDGTLARSIGFELSLAAAAARCNLPISLEPPADIMIPIQPHSFVIECKRPFAVRKIENRIRKGLRQLVRRYNASEDPANARGILAVSISKTENDGSSALEGPMRLPYGPRSTRSSIPLLLDTKGIGRPELTVGRWP